MLRALVRLLFRGAEVHFSAEVRAPILVGAVAFVTLTFLEVALSISLFHRSMVECLPDLRSLASEIDLAAQVCFATFPLLGVVLRRRLSLSVYKPL